MRLLTGPAGSGKTTFVLDRFREALRARETSVRLLVPTATMAQHLRNRIAREGFVFRRNRSRPSPSSSAVGRRSARGARSACST